MKNIKLVFISGLKVLAPILVTLLLLYWIYIGFERLFRSVLLLFIDDSVYFNGLGWIVSVFIIIIFGLLIQIPFLKKGEEKISAQILKLPVIRPLYRMTSDIMMFLTKKGVDQGKIVKLKTPIGNILGILTQEQLKKLSSDIGNEKEVAVYVPMSYQVGGFTFIVPKDSIEPLDISVQEGIALTMSAYISGKD